MQIDYVIHAVEQNHSELDFWQIISEIWQKKLTINPVLFILGNQDKSNPRKINQKPR